ncbi:MAG: hypothetical protein LBV71_03640 [Prevotella sp.]|jgi:hypothetical protein|nr:hypothetical protein [Prevotella sp.]
MKISDSDYYIPFPLFAQSTVFQSDRQSRVPAGTGYTYYWNFRTRMGRTLPKHIQGKTIFVSKAGVTGKGVLMCEISK